MVKPTLEEIRASDLTPLERELALASRVIGVVQRLPPQLLPLVVGFPETAARVNADLRIVDARQNGDLFSTNLSGVGRKSRGVRMFPVSGDDRTSYLTEVEKNKVWDDAINQVVVSLLRQLSENFKWFPG